MFNLLKKRTLPTDLLKSSLHDERTFYQAFTRDLKHAKREVIIESPYMTVPRVNSLLPLFNKLTKHGIKVTVNTRFPGHHDKQLRIQAWMATKDLKSCGIKVRFFDDYRHRKIAMIDGWILYEGSLNILSQRRSCEVMRRIESEQLTRQMVSFLHLKKYYW